MGHFWLQSAKEALYRSVCSKAVNILLSEFAAFIILNQSPISSPGCSGSLAYLAVTASSVAVHSATEMDLNLEGVLRLNGLNKLLPEKLVKV